MFDTTDGTSGLDVGTIPAGWGLAGVVVEVDVPFDGVTPKMFVTLEPADSPLFGAVFLPLDQPYAYSDTLPYPQPGQTVHLALTLAGATNGRGIATMTVKKLP